MLMIAKKKNYYVVSRFWGLMTAKKKNYYVVSSYLLHSIFKKLLCGVLIPDYVCVRIQVKMLRSNGCTRMRTYADACGRMRTYADVCSYYVILLRMCPHTSYVRIVLYTCLHTGGGGSEVQWCVDSCGCWRMLTYPDVSWRIQVEEVLRCNRVKTPADADVCWRMLTYADVYRWRRFWGAMVSRLLRMCSK